MRNLRVALALVMAVWLLSIPVAASANSPHYSQRISHSTCEFDLYHRYDSNDGSADTENKGGCSEVYARIKANGTWSSWYVGTSKAIAASGGTGYVFNSSQGKARVTGGSISPVWGFS